MVGLDVAAEGPFTKKKNSSFLVNYRYSTLGLLSAMGVELGDEAISFQDLSFNLSFPTEKAGKFTIFGMGGISENVFSHKSQFWCEVFYLGKAVIYGSGIIEKRSLQMSQQKFQLSPV